MNRRDFIDKENYDDSGGSVPKRTIIIKLVKCLFAHHFSTNQLAERNELSLSNLWRSRRSSARKERVKSAVARAVLCASSSVIR